MTEFLTPVSESILDLIEDLPIGTLGQSVLFHSKEDGLPEIKKGQIAILGILENRKSEFDLKESLDLDPLRKAFYSLYSGSWNKEIIDLGDIHPGATPEDSRFALRVIVESLLKENVIPVILGGGQEMLYSQYRAYDSLGRMVNMVNIDSRFDLGNAENPLSSNSYVGKIIVDKPYNLLNYSVLGYQSYFNSPEEIALMEKLFFDACRLGDLISDLSSSEPIFRDADLVALDITSVKSRELDGLHFGPNGFDSREICALSRYAGISNRLSSFGIYELQSDLSPAASMLIAQVLWYFIEGVNFRIQDEDFYNEEYFTTYVVPLEDMDLVFKKSNKSERWWIELPFFSGKDNKYKNPALLPCTYEDYIGACNQIIPERWWKARLKSEMG